MSTAAAFSLAQFSTDDLLNASEWRDGVKS
jgi:hypothetical protein